MGNEIADAYRRAGLYAGRILKGAKPADLPIDRATKFELIINVQTARTLKFEIPARLLATADEMIDDQPPRVHHASRRRGGGMAAWGARAAAPRTHEANWRVHAWNSG